MASRPARHYTMWEVLGVLAIAAAAAVALDSQGLLVWTGRKSVGRFQSALLFGLVPAHRVLTRIGLTEPMRDAHRYADALALELTGAPADALPGASTELLPGEENDAGPDLLEMEPLMVVAAEEPERPQLAVSEELLQPGASNLPLPPGEGTPSPQSAQPRTELAAAEDAGPRLGRMTVLLVGDSMMAAGLASAITRGLEDEEGVHVVRAYKEATGLSRPDVYDWMEVLPPVIEQSRPDLVVCSLGGNDVQSIRDGDEVLEAGTRRWRTEYRRRVHRFMRLLSGSGRSVLWLGLPVMRAADFNERTTRMNEIFQQEAQTVARVRFQESTPAVAAADGSFTSFGPDLDGNLVQLRMDDGVHYARAGGDAVARLALAWLHHPNEPDLTVALHLPSMPWR